MQKRQFIRKVCLIGDGAVGKTSLIRRYVLDVFGDEYISTFGAKVTKKVVEIGDIELTMMIWDILGQKNGASMHSAYFSGANGAMIVCDNTRPETLDHVGSWYGEFSKVAGKVPVLPIVNKCDLDTALGQDRIAHMSGIIGLEHCGTSAKTGEGVEEAFLKLGHLMVGG